MRRIVGIPAKRQAITNPENTIFSSKRFIGRKYNEVQSEIKTVPFKVTAMTMETPSLKCKGKIVTPEEIAAQVLIKMKETAEAYLGEKVTEAVITVLPTSTTRKDNRLKMPDVLQDLMSNGSFLSLLLLPWPMV